MRILFFGLIAPGLLVKWVSFLNSLHWPIGDLETLGLVVFLMWNCSSCMSFGLVRDFLWRKLTHAIFVQGAQFQCRLFLLFGPGIDIWRSCRFIGAMMQSLCLLPGGLGRFVPCSIGANHCRLRHIFVGRGVVMVLLLDLVEVLQSSSRMSF